MLLQQSFSTNESSSIQKLGGGGVLKEHFKYEKVSVCNKKKSCIKTLKFCHWLTDQISVLLLSASEPDHLVTLSCTTCACDLRFLVLGSYFWFWQTIPNKQFSPSSALNTCLCKVLNSSHFSANHAFQKAVWQLDDLFSDWRITINQGLIWQNTICFYM